MAIVKLFKAEWKLELFEMAGLRFQEYEINEIETSSFMGDIYRQEFFNKSQRSTFCTSILNLVASFQLTTKLQMRLVICFTRQRAKGSVCAVAAGEK